MENSPLPSSPSNSILKKIGLYIVKAVHIACSILCLVGPYLTNDVLYLSLLVLYSAGTYFFWYTLGYCFFTSFEEYLGEPPSIYEDGMKKSFMASAIQMIGLPESIVSNMFVIVPAISVFVCMYKINMQYKFAINQMSFTLPTPIEEVPIQ
jgi:hypothetical protein